MPVTDVFVHPGASSIVFGRCQRQLLCGSCSVDTPLRYKCSRPSGHSSGFCNMYQDNVDNTFLHTCCISDLGPVRVVGSRLANVVLCKQELKKQEYKLLFDLKSSI